MKLITDLVEKTAQNYPDKIAFVDVASSIPYSRLTAEAKAAASSLLQLDRLRAPIVIYMDKGIACITAMLAVAYSGNFYAVIDPQMPDERVRTIFQTLNPVAVLTVRALAERAGSAAGECRLFILEDMLEEPVQDEALDAVHRQMTDTDLLYCLFTSGSTGVPKGTAVTHRNVLTYSQWVVETFGITEETVFGNQAPFYFSMSVTDIFSTLRSGATMAIIPKSFFMFPAKLAAFMNREGVNTIYWVPSALSIVANLDVLKYVKLEKLEKILFAGEVMPVKQLNYWRRNFPDALFANLFGPTETTDICTYYKVDRPFEETQSLPIGRACDNCGVLVIGEDGKACAPGQKGELYVRGSFVAQGYYNAPEKTAAAFVQNPLNTAYPEIVYKTGDIVWENERGELMYAGRRDFQIKHMGYRIELGEIEAAASALEGVGEQVCLYDRAADSIVLIYSGSADKESVRAGLERRVPLYMMPACIILTTSFPRNSNEKIDRAWLGSHYKTLLEGEGNGKTTCNS